MRRSYSPQYDFLDQRIHAGLVKLDARLKSVFPVKNHLDIRGFWGPITLIDVPEALHAVSTVEGLDPHHMSRRELGEAFLASGTASRIAGEHLWRRYGQPVFEIGTAHFNAFSITDANFDISEVSFPFPVFYVAIPEEAELFYRGDPVDGVLVKVIHADERTLVDFLIYIRDDTNGEDPGVVMFQLALTPGQSVDDWIDVNLSAMERDHSMNRETRTIIGTMMRVVFNSMMYLSSFGSDVDKDSLLRAQRRSRDIKTARKEENFNKSSRASVIRVGHRYALKDKKAEDALSGSSSSLSVRSMTRGHWRMQPHGPGRQLRKILWIEPFWRGPKGAPVQDKVYVFDDDEPRKNPWGY